MVILTLEQRLNISRKRKISHAIVVLPTIARIILAK